MTSPPPGRWTATHHLDRRALPRAEYRRTAPGLLELAGLRCAVVGFSLQCVPEGSSDVGAACTTSTDCFAGLACVSEQCARAPAGVPTFGGTPWPGVDCQDSAYTNVRAYFEVPGAAGADERDFFRLPFPNDVRRVDSKLDLSGFPTPGTGMFVAPIGPATPVCEHGGMQVSAFSPA